MNSRYIVGIDLGTTNCVVGFLDTQESDDGTPGIRLLPLPQAVDAGVVEARDLLPSFLYLPAPSELPGKSLALPWAEDMPFVVGEFARKRGGEVPLRLVSSAKSWLSSPAVDRTAPLLPWHAPEGVEKMSPLDVSAQYLAHIREAWNHTVARGNADYSLERQTVLITVPASFDAVARDLTVRAAERAGLTNTTLLEEPQAAFYAWISGSGEAWRRQVGVGDVVLVCDIGGGTTDFSIIEVAEEAGSLSLRRVAVGEHILLGGDNMDLALAFTARSRFAEKGITLDTKQTMGLVQQCREAKEIMLNDPSCSSRPVTILGRGRGVVGGTIQTELERADVERSIVEGFFPECSLADAPVERRAAGLRELGLQYAADTAVTRHLAKFLRQNGLTPTKVLFNGGVTKAALLRNRVTARLDAWRAEEAGEGKAQVTVLADIDPERAVAVGAAYYGSAKRGRGVRIRAGAARAYYIGVETSMPAVPGMPPPLKAICVVPFGMEEGTYFALAGQEFGLVVGEPAAFRFLTSLTRKDDPPGAVVEEWEAEELAELAPLETVLPAEGMEPGTVVPVRLHSSLTETGMLELWCEPAQAGSGQGAGRWKLEFNVREAAAVH